MKSQQSEIKTNCKDCIFAIYENNVQVNYCKANRLEKFISLNNYKNFKDDEKEWYCLTRFCNMYRNEPITLELARSQVETSFGIVIYDYDNLSEIDTAINSIKELDYDKSKIKIVISSHHNKNSAALFNRVKELNETGLCAKFIMTLAKVDIDREAFSNVINCAYIMKINHNDKINKNILKEINDALNLKLEKIIYFESNNIGILPMWYINNEYLNFNDYDLMLSDAKEKAIINNMYKKI